MDRKRKAQMFVVTLIFMAELIFVVQNSLIQYSDTDLTAGFDDFPRELLESVRMSANKTVRQAGSCSEVNDTIRTFAVFVTNRTLPRYSLDLKYSIDCSAWGNSPPNPEVLNLTVFVGGTGFDLKENYRIYHS